LSADLVVLNARVATMDPNRPYAEAVAVKDGRIVDVGTTGAVREWVGRFTAVIDARGRRLIPGLIDCHMHLLGYGFALEQVPAHEAHSLEDLGALVKAAADRTPAGAWIRGRGWDEELWGGRLPDRALLDAVAPEHPVIIHRRCGHIAVANTRAFVLAGLLDQTTVAEGGVIDRDGAGWPTGILRELAIDRITRAIPALTEADYRRAFRAAAESASRHGLTGVHTNDGQGWAIETIYQLYRELQGGGDRLPLRIWWDFDNADLEKTIAWGWQTGYGDEWFKVGSAKIFTDGSLGGHTAALKAPYSDNPSTAGLYLWETDALAARMELAQRHGFQLAVHAIGDGSFEQTLAAYRQALQAAAGAMKTPRHPAVARLRMIHCQIMFPELWPQMLELGAVADVQPRFISSDYPILESRVGAERAATSYAWRTMARMGIPMGFGSDCPVEPINPLHAIYAAVTRQTMDGAPEGGYQPYERFSVAEAIAHHTRGAAYAVGEEREKGQLTPGYLADMVLLEQDPFSVAPSAIKDITVAMTILGGKVVYAAE
jgi:predicted amidohydrolase YtcJ